MATITDIQKLYSQFLGFTPSSQDTSKLSMMSPAEVEDVLRNTKSEVQSQATQKAQSNISSLMSPEGGMLPPSVSQYLTSMAQGREMLADRYGLSEAERQAKEAEQFYLSQTQKAPMFETFMTGGLQQASPTFLGATRKDMEEFFGGIENPFVRESMVNSYMSAADRSMTATLKALNGLYQTSVSAALSAAEMERGNYQRIADKVKDLYSELQWANRNRFQEEMGLESYEKKLQMQEQYRGDEGLAPSIDNWAWLYNMGEVNASQIPQDLREPVITKAHELDPMRAVRMKAEEFYSGGGKREEFINSWKQSNKEELDKMTPEEKSRLEQQITEVANAIWGEPTGGIRGWFGKRVEGVKTFFGF